MWAWRAGWRKGCGLRPRHSASARQRKIAGKVRGRFWRSGARRLRGSEHMSKVLEGQLSAAGLRFAIVVSRFNSFITERLLGGAMDALTRAGGSADLIDVIKVPGSWEVPMIAGEVARQHRYDAVICLSAVIRGDTPHFDYVAAEAAKGIAHVAAETGVPVAFGGKSRPSRWLCCCVWRALCSILADRAGPATLGRSPRRPRAGRNRRTPRLAGRSTASRPASRLRSRSRSSTMEDSINRLRST